MTFRDRSCVVTGASRGIGRSISLALAGDGARVWAIGRSEERLRAVVAESDESAGELVPIEADLEREEDIASASRAIVSQSGRVDVLVHAAGAIALGTLESLSSAAVDEMLSVNLRAPILLTQSLLPALKAARGQIVFVNSLAADAASADNAVYAATKLGLGALAEGLRAQVNPDGVRVVSAYIGRTATPMQVAVHEQEGRPYRPELLLQPEDVAGFVLSALVLPRSGEVIDVRLRPAVKPPST